MQVVQIYVGFSHLEKSPFAQARAYIAFANAKKSNRRYLGLAPVGPKIKISET